MVRLVLLTALTGCAGAGSGHGTTAATIGGDDGSSGAGADATGSDDGGTSSGDDGSGTATGGGGVCAPGMQIACDCAGGEQGTQVCNDMGTGYEPCDCGAADTTGPAVTTNDDADPSGDPVQCDPQWMCGDCTSCVLDCGDCNGCINCTAFNDCGDIYGTCQADAQCHAAVDCLVMCGLTEECADSCQPADAAAAGTFDGLINCVGTACVEPCAP